MSEEKSKLAELDSVVRRLREILDPPYGGQGELYNALAIPNSRVRALQYTKITTDSYDRKPDPLVVAAAAELTSAVKSALLAKGIAERDEKIATLETEVSTLASALCSMAASASIEAGIKFRTATAELKAGAE